MADGLRHGFKADAERIAESVRAELELEPWQPLDCLALATPRRRGHHRE